jgi:asparagine N-glycosylation enzyme membrane subunit Stt3
MAATTLASTHVATWLVQGLAFIGLLVVLYFACREAYDIRLYAIKEYGPIIHEFDPYFNYRATEVRIHRLCIRRWICRCML